MALKLLFERDNMYIYPWYISDLTIAKDIKSISGMFVKKVVVYIENDRIHMYYDRQSSNAVGEKFLEKLLSDKSFFYKSINNIYKYSDELMFFCGKIDEITNIEKLSDKELLATYLDYVNKMRVLRTWGWIPSSMDGLEKAFLSDHLVNAFRKYLQKIGKEEKFSDYYTALSSSEKKSEVQEEELARLNLLLRISKDKKAKQIIADIRKNEVANFGRKYPKNSQLLERHLKDFGWLTYAYAGPTMTSDYLLKSLAENIKAGNIKGQKEKIIAHYKSIKNEKKKIIREINLPNKLVYAFEISAEMMFIKDYRKGIYQKSYVAMDRVIEEMARRLRMLPKEVKYLVVEDIKDAMRNNRRKKYQKIASKRIKFCCYVVEKGRIKVFEGKKAKQIVAKLRKEDKKEEPKSGEIKELKGMMAYKGKVRGIVRVILVAKDMSKMNSGDILVSSATNPDLIMAMKKSAAIVTDTGGIISHAAIVSRELKKPCIVGTKIATKVLKDGDRVEVDANSGVVKKI